MMGEYPISEQDNPVLAEFIVFHSPVEERLTGNTWVGLVIALLALLVGVALAYRALTGELYPAIWIAVMCIGAGLLILLASLNSLIFVRQK